MLIIRHEDKVNFVDKNNVFVGYDLSQQCCETAGFFIHDKEIDVIQEKSIESVSDYVFDKTYFELVQLKDYESKIARFKLVAKGKKSLFLHLYNCHNGYYSHGFEFMNGKKIMKEGLL